MTTEYDNNAYTLSREAFIKRARRVHGDKYDYSKVDFVNADTEVTVICPIHRRVQGYS